jgi:hypothetical protein
VLTLILFFVVLPLGCFLVTRKWFWIVAAGLALYLYWPQVTHFFDSEAGGRFLGIAFVIMLFKGVSIVQEQNAQHRAENPELYAMAAHKRQLRVERYQAWRNAKLKAFWYWLSRPLLGRLRPSKAVDLIAPDGRKRLWDVVYRAGPVTVERPRN